MSSGDDSALLSKIVAGKYRVESFIAKGGMGVVYKAAQLPLERPVALKILRPPESEGGAADLESFQKRFFLEANTLSRLQHPNIVTIYDYGKVEITDEETYFMAMEYVAGETLARRLKTVGRIEPYAAIAIVRQMARALRAAHAQKIIHRDLKPSNVMLSPLGDGEDLVKVVDFGIVKVLSDDPEQLTRAGTFLGSPRYIPPEQVRGLPVDLRADVYSLGVIFYHMLAGEPPFTGAIVDVLSAHVKKAPPPLRTTAPDLDLPAEVEQFVMKCLEKTPAARHADMDDVLSGLLSCEEALEAQAKVGLRLSMRVPDRELSPISSDATPEGKGELKASPAALTGASRPLDKTGPMARLPTLPEPKKLSPRRIPPPAEPRQTLGVVAWSIFAIGLLVLAAGLFVALRR